CAGCGGDKMRPVGSGKPSVVYEYVQPHFRKRVFRRETLSCRCGHIVTAPAPARVGEKTRYAPSFIAHLIVTKCADSIPQYRLERAYRNIGIPMSRSTMYSLLQREGRELRPLQEAADRPRARCTRRTRRRDQHASARHRTSRFLLDLRHARPRRVSLCPRSQW